MRESSATALKTPSSNAAMNIKCIHEVPRAKMKKFTIKFLRDNKGVTALEYGLIAGLIAVVIAGSVGTLGGDLNGVFASIANTITPAK
jgi:pilus assembly protein Flp/PilA